MIEDVAERRLETAVAEQTRLTTRYQDSIGTAGEFDAYARLESATLAVTNCGRALKASRTESSDRFSFVVLCGLDCPRAARAEVKRRIRGLIDTEVIDDVILLVSELVTNAVKHGVASDSATVAVNGDISELTLHIDVSNDGSTFEPQLGGPDNREPGGRGLYLVDQLSHAWGTYHEGGQTTVWFEVNRILELATKTVDPARLN